MCVFVLPNGMLLARQLASQAADHAAGDGAGAGEGDQQDEAALGHDRFSLGESIHTAVIRCFLSNLNLPGQEAFLGEGTGPSGQP